MRNIFLNTSFYAHTANIILLVIALIILYKNYARILKLEPYKQIGLVLLFSISIGIHSLSHLELEKTYSYNPMAFIFGK